MDRNQVRGFSILLGIGLLVLWIAGLNTPLSAAWLSWLDGAAGLLAFGIAAGTPTISEPTVRRTFSSGPIALSVSLFVLWVIGLAVKVPAWQAWWTFAFAAAFLLLGVGAASGRKMPSVSMEQERERFRRSA